MDFTQNPLAAIQNAQKETFRSKYKIGPKEPYALTDEEFVMAQYVSSPRRGGTTVVDIESRAVVAMKEALPAPLHPYYDTRRVDRRFARFVLLAKSHGEGATNDGILVGIANDDFYYVLAVWDMHGHDIWEPNPGGIGTRLVVWT